MKGNFVAHERQPACLLYVRTTVTVHLELDMYWVNLPIMSGHAWTGHVLSELAHHVRTCMNWTCTEWTCPSCPDMYELDMYWVNLPIMSGHVWNMYERVGVLPGQHVRSCSVMWGGSARRCVSFAVAAAGRCVWSLVWCQQACLGVSVGSARDQRLIPLVNAADVWRAAASWKWWYHHRRVTVYIRGQSRSAEDQMRWQNRETVRQFRVTFVVIHW